MGRRLALFFPDVSRAVGFFRSYSREVSLDEILSSLEIKEAISERGGREILVTFETVGSYVEGVDKTGFVKAAQPIQDQLAIELGPHAVKLLKLVRDVQ